MKFDPELLKRLTVMKPELEIRIKHHNKISKILNKYGLNVFYSGIDEHKFYIYYLNDSIHVPMSKRIVADLSEWKYVVRQKQKDLKLLTI